MSTAQWLDIILNRRTRSPVAGTSRCSMVMTWKPWGQTGGNQSEAMGNRPGGSFANGSLALGFALQGLARAFGTLLSIVVAVPLHRQNTKRCDHVRALQFVLLVYGAHGRESVQYLGYSKDLLTRFESSVERSETHDLWKVIIAI